MSLDLQDHVTDETRQRHAFHSIEYIGKGHQNDGWKQRFAAIGIAVLLCSALFGMLYLAVRT